MNAQLKAELTSITVNNMAKIFTGNGRRVSNVPGPSGGKRPKFVIKYGPPASGKGSAGVRAVMKKFGDPLSSYINISVDDVVESTQAFKNRSRALVNSLLKNPTNANFNAFLNHATAEQVKAFASAYTSVRFGKNMTGANFGAKLNDVLIQALEAGKNITFETTGALKFPSWIWSTYKDLLRKYRIYIIFPMVPFEETWRRYKKRPANAYRNGVSGFRFASTKSQLRQDYVSSYKFMRGALGSTKVSWVDKIYLLPFSEPTPYIIYPKRESGNRQGPAIRKILSPYINNTNK